MQLSDIENYLSGMDKQYIVLHTLSSMVAEAPQPTLYQCIPRELILRMPFDWAEIYTCLVALEQDGYVQLFQADGVKYSITQKGIDKAGELLGQSEKIDVLYFK